MKKILSASVAFICLGVCGLQAQSDGKSEVKSGTETSTAPYSTARGSKGVGKGTPIVQRKADEGAKESDAPAPGAPIDKTEEKVITTRPGEKTKTQPSGKAAISNPKEQPVPKE